MCRQLCLIRQALTWPGSHIAWCWLQLFGLMCEASDFMPPSPPIQGKRGQPQVNQHGQSFAGPLRMKFLSAPSLLGRRSSNSHPTDGLALERGFPPFSSLPPHPHAPSGHMSEGRQVMASPFQGAAASLLAAIAQSEISLDSQIELGTPPVMNAVIGGTDDAADDSLGRSAAVPHISPSGWNLTPAHLTNDRAQGAASQMQTPRHGDASPPGLRLSPAHAGIQQAQTPASGAHVQNPDAAGTESSRDSRTLVPEDVASQHGGSCWSKDSPIKGEKVVTGPWHAGNASASDPSGPFHKSPSVPGLRGRSVPSNCPEAMEAPSGIRVTPLTRQGTGNDPGTLPLNIVVSEAPSSIGQPALAEGFSKTSQPAHLVRRNLSADLQAVAPPAARDNLPANESDEVRSTLPSAVPDAWFGPAKPGLSWADDDVTSMTPQPAPTSCPSDITGADMASSAAASFAGLSLGHASRKLPGCTAPKCNEAASSTGLVQQTPTKPTGLEGLGMTQAWPSTAEAKHPLGGLHSATPFWPQSPNMSLERSSSSGSASWGLGGSATRQPSTGTLLTAQVDNACCQQHCCCVLDIGVDGYSNASALVCAAPPQGMLVYPCSPCCEFLVWVVHLQRCTQWIK